MRKDESREPVFRETQPRPMPRRPKGGPTPPNSFIPHNLPTNISTRLGISIELNIVISTRSGSSKTRYTLHSTRETKARSAHASLNRSSRHPRLHQGSCNTSIISCEISLLGSYYPSSRPDLVRSVHDQVGLAESPSLAVQSVPHPMITYVARPPSGWYIPSCTIKRSMERGQSQLAHLDASERTRDRDDQTGRGRRGREEEG